MKTSTYRVFYPLVCLFACLLLPATALAQPVFKSIYGDYEEDDYRIYLDVPGGTAVGDFMLVIIALSNDEEVTDIPSGWTELTDYDQSLLRVWVGWKFATQADLGDSFRWDFDDDADIVGQLRVYSNVDSANPINAWDASDDDSNDVVAPAVTTTVNDTMIVRLFGAEYDSEPDPITPAHNNEYFEDACWCVEDGVVQGSADLPQPVAGDSGTASWDNLDEDDWIAVTVALAPAESRATFVIDKQWNQLGDTDGIPVTGHLSCTGAFSTQQNVVFTATTDAILFVYDISQIPEGQQVDCTVTEDVPDNYTARYACEEENCGDSQQRVDGCFFPAVDPNGTYTCTITNTPLPAHITVTKTWVIEGADQGFNGYHEVALVCSERVKSPFGEPYDYCLKQANVCVAYIAQPDATEGSVDYEFTIPKPAYPFTRCFVDEYNRDNVIEVDNGCGRLRLHAGDDVDCEIVNTVFFEGIPTLSQYGTAILALLMLGVGLAGFRRFV